MKHLKKRKNTFLALCATALSSAILIVACQKGTESVSIAKFDNAAAKEWYYGTFKKSAEWASYNAAANGVKSPDWKYSTYRRVGNMEIVEFPLIKVKSSIFIPSEAGRSAADNKRLVESALTRVAFIKTGSKIIVREVDYIPDAAYAMKKGYDISSNSIGRFDADFSGRIVIGKWNGKELSRRLVEKGRITRTGKLKQGQVAATAAIMQRDAVNTQECWTFQICEYEQFCEYAWQGDALVKVCDPWEPTGNCWYEEYCEGDDPCMGLSEEQCACALYGDCGNDNEPIVRCSEKAQEIFDNASVMSEKESVEEVSNDGSTRIRNYSWKVYTVSDGLIPMYLNSLEKGVHINPNGYWKFESLTHDKVIKKGTEILYSVNIGESVGTPTYESHLGRPMQVANMHLTCPVAISVICDGLPVVDNDDIDTSTSWHVSE